MFRKLCALAVIAICQVAVLGLWFSATAIVPALRAEFGLDDFLASLFSSAVMAGFVCGTLFSAVLGLADRLDNRRLFMACALAGAAANAAILAVEPVSYTVVVLRFVTGACMAGVYPVGMRMVASWARRDLGLLVGLLTGALTLGSAAPHLFGAFAGADWRATLIVASAVAVAGGLSINLARLGPNQAKAPPFNPAFALRAWRNTALRLANAGYLGHMWELYAMWTWIGIFLLASFQAVMPAAEAGLYAKLATFATVGVGAVGCLAGGYLADRVGRTTLTMGAMAVSGACAIVAGFLFGGPPWLVVALCLVWGVAVVADSAQFSASVAELAEPELIGTMLTVQTSCGFLLALIAIHLVPVGLAWLGWSWAFVILAPGPLFGVWAMARLRAHPDALRLAGGRR
jgi:MFS family permease